MCLAVPMRIVSIADHMAWCEARGVRREVSLTLVADGPVAVGDYVLVHVGYALQIVPEADARAIWDLFDEVTTALDCAGA